MRLLKCRWGFASILWVFFFLSATPASAWRSDIAQDTKDAFNNTLRLVRSQNMLLPMTYLEVEGEVYGYSLPRRFAVMANSGDKFRIRKVKSKDNYIIVELESNRQARIEVYIFDVENEVTRRLSDVVFPMVLSDVFEFRDPPQFPRVVVNNSSNLAHIGACNHLPPEELRESFQDLEAAKNAGFLPCPACFPPDPGLPIPNYMPIRIDAVERARLFERAFPPVSDLDVQERVQILGEKLVEAFPIPSKGFPYKFRVVESEVMMGISYPTGFVYLTDKLLGAVENEIELAHVLSHEIAHCELHLPPNSQISEPSPLLPLEFVEPAWKNYFEQVRWHETEADFLAITAVGSLFPDEDVANGAVSILSKLQFANEAFPIHEDGPYDTHPAYGGRLLALKNGFFPVLSKQYFEARDDNGAWVCRIRVLGGGWTESDNSLIYLLVELAHGAKDGISLKSAQTSDYEFGTASLGTEGEIVFDNDTKYNLSSNRNINISPGFTKTLVLNVKGADKMEFGPKTETYPNRHDPSIIRQLEISLNQKVKWHQVPGDWF